MNSKRMNQLKHLLDQHINFNLEEWEVFIELCDPVITLPPKSILTNFHQRETKIYFIKKGLLRLYYLEEGKEINVSFVTDNQFASSFSSLITHSPSLEALITIEESTLISISYEKLIALYLQFPKFERFGRIFTEQKYLCIATRNRILQSKKANDKYDDFVKSHDSKIISNVPQYHIASYLGIEPESLSRIRKKSLNIYQ
jgi:CRP-like cAMP-binding protein